MIKEINLGEPAVLTELYCLQKRSYQIEADLIGFAGIPPLLETVDDLKNCGETFYGYWENSRLAGMTAVSEKDSECTICRLAVHPDFFRKGIGRKLIEFTISQLPYETFIVSTGKENAPARKLYEKLGFKHTGDQELTDARITISHYMFVKKPL